MIAFKRHRRNSIFYAKERKYITAKALGISVNTFGKYLLKLESFGLVTWSNGCRVFAKLSECIKLLLKKSGRSFKAFKLVPLSKKCCFKAVYLQLQTGIVAQNINHQEYRNSQFKAAKIALESNRIKRKGFELINQVKKYHNFECIDQALSIDEKDLRPKTGKYHIASLLGASPSTGLKRLRNWNRDGIIIRSIVTKKLLPANASTFDLLKEKYKYLLINNDGNFYAQIGSTIVFNN